LVAKYYPAWNIVDNDHDPQVKQRALALIRAANIAAKSHSGGGAAICGYGITLKDTLDYMNRTSFPDELLRSDREHDGWPFP
jgi:hypothetical protein